ncbi:unnamed protein product [Scytosiphon promiscuus]
MVSLFDGTSLSENRIRSLLRLRGSLPTEYRVTAWKFLLHLPGNSRQFARLVSGGPNPAVLASLAVRYPLRDRRMARKTAVLVSALASWSPIMAEVEFVPGWVFPFVVVFAQDDLGAFEAALSFFLHWGSRLLVTFPQPPVPVLAGMELVMRRADRELAAHLTSLKLGALSYGWPLLRSVFAEVLPRYSWLRLMDRLLANADKPELLEAAAVGFAVASRAQLLAIESTGEAKTFFRRQQPTSDLDLGTMFRVMERVSDFGPPGEWRRADRGINGSDGGSGGAGGAMSALSLLRSPPREFKPLPRLGAYPYYNGYPEFVIDYQAEMRQRVVRQEHAVAQKGFSVACGGWRNSLEPKRLRRQRKKVAANK